MEAEEVILRNPTRLRKVEVKEVRWILLAALGAPGGNLDLATGPFSPLLTASLTAVFFWAAEGVYQESGDCCNCPLAVRFVSVVHSLTPVPYRDVGVAFIETSGCADEEIALFAASAAARNERRFRFIQRDAEYRRKCTWGHLVCSWGVVKG